MSVYLSPKEIKEIREEQRKDNSKEENEKIKALNRLLP